MFKIRRPNAKPKAPVQETVYPDSSPAYRSKPPSTVSIVEYVLDKRRQQPAGYFRPSGFGGCDRNNVYHYRREPEELPQHDNRMWKILDIGTKLHDLFQKDYFSEHPDILFVPEPKVEGLLGPRRARVQGHADGVLIRRSDGYRWLLEIKTKSPAAFKSLKEPEPSHVWQVTLYARLLGLHWASIYYFCKGSNAVKEFQVEVTDKQWDKAVKRATHLKMYVDNGTLPKYDENTCSKKFCRWVDRCGRDPGGWNT